MQLDELRALAASGVLDYDGQPFPVLPPLPPCRIVKVISVVPVVKE